VCVICESLKIEGEAAGGGDDTGEAANEDAELEAEIGERVVVVSRVEGSCR